MGLIQVMKHLEDIKEVGHGIAVAFVATVYGVGTANILFLPMANKLKARMRAARLMKEMMLEGVIGSGERRYHAHRPPRQRAPHHHPPNPPRRGAKKTPPPVGEPSPKPAPAA